MARYRVIVPEIWDDIWFGSLSKSQKLYWIYLLTNHQTHASGLYQLNPRIAPAILGLTPQTISTAQEKFTVAGKAQFEDGWIFVTNFIKHQPPPNESVWKHVIDRVTQAPLRLRRRWLDHYEGIIPPGHTVPPPCPDGVCTETETVQRQKRDGTETERETETKSPPTSSTVRYIEAKHVPKAVGDLLKLQETTAPGVTERFINLLDRLAHETAIKPVLRILRQMAHEPGLQDVRHPARYFQKMFDRQLPDWADEIEREQNMRRILQDQGKRMQGEA